MLTLTLIWIAIGLCASFVQFWAWEYARRAWLIARPFGENSNVLVMAHARLRSNTVRMFGAIPVNLLIGVLSLFHTITAPTILPFISLLVAFGFIGNEIAMIWVATLEVHAHRKLRENWNEAL